VVLTSEWSARHPLAPLTLVQVATTLAGTAVLAAAEPVRIDPGPELLGIVLYTGLGFTAGAFFLMNWAQRRTSAVRAALIYALEPPAAAVFSHAMGAETLGPLDWAGGALIVVGVVAGEAGAAWAARRASAAGGASQLSET
jgi:drug/metabolite transporter (DMT)-like permease